MIGIMRSASREKAAGLMKSAKFAVDVSSKFDLLRQLKAQLSRDNSGGLSELLSHLFDLLSDQSAPARKLVTEIVGEIGVKHFEFIPEVVPVLMGVLEDDVPAVARQSITCGIDLFRCTLVKVAVKGLYSSELDDDLELSWSWMLKFKEKICSLAFQPGSGGVKLLAQKFVEAMIILYTPDPNGPSEPPASEGTTADFNISWLRGGHPLLDVGDLSIEASQRLGLLLDQLRYPTGKSLSSTAIIVLINSLSGIATKRPAYYGRILPVLLGLDPPSFVIKGVHVYGTRRALKNAFIACLKCTHPSAAPWRDRIQAALKEMEAGVVMDRVLGHKDNGIVKEETHDSLSDVKVEVASDNSSDGLRDKVGRKRSGAEDINNLSAHDYGSGKRVRSSPSASEESMHESNKNVTESKEDTCSAQPTGSRDIDNGPVQQLVSMFGALVAQGEKAVGSLEILIASISADLLAEVVMANMRNLPPDSSEPEGGDELLQNMSIVGSDSQTKYPSSFLSSVLSLSSTFPPIASLLDSQQTASDDILKTEMEEDNDVAVNDSDAVVNASSMTHGAENAILPSDIPVCSDIILPGMGKVNVAASFDMTDLSNIDSQIPGLNSSVHNEGLSDIQAASSLVSTNVEDASQEQVMSFSGRSPLNVLPSMSNDRSDELSPKTAVMDSNNIVSSTATSSVSSCPIVLPKMSAPVVSLSDKQKDNLQKLVYIHITEAYKQIEAGGGSQVRFSLLAYLGIELPPEIDPWKSLREHILSDYINHEGHELTLHVLYRLHGVAEEEHDFLSCTTAASAYETFLHIVAETLRDSFPPSDKSLSKLLGEVPYLPKSVLNLLEGLCCPESLDKMERAQQYGDRVTQGLSCVWSLILLRPPFRNDCLKIALQSAVHQLEEVRMKAIRLVVNKLFPLPSISHQIEDFAKEMLLSVVNISGTETMEVEGSTTELQKVPDLDAFNENQSRNASTKDIDADVNLSGRSQNTSFISIPEVPDLDGFNENQSRNASTKDIDADVNLLGRSQNTSSISIPETQRLLSLYFALCTKKHSLFCEIFVIYRSAPKEVKQAVNRHIPILVRTMGASSELLEIIADPPSGSEDLLMQVLHTLTDGIVPSKELLFTIRKLFDTKLKDMEILVPVLPYLPRDEVLQLFPHLVNLPLDKFQAALTRLIQGSAHAGPVLSPAEVLAGIHGIDPERDGIPLKKVTNACNACFEQHQIFTQQVLAKVLNQLVEQTPLPLLFMRTVLQAIGTFPALVDYIMEILSRLVSKQIWKYPKLWVGFLKCAQLTKPQSFGVLLQLPPPQLENAVNRIPALKPQLVAHASQPNIQSTLPRSVLVVLGLAPDSQASGQAQTSEAQTVDTGNSEKDLSAEKTKESSGTS